MRSSTSDAAWKPERLSPAEARVRARRGTPAFDSLKESLGDLFLLRNPRCKFDTDCAPDQAAFQKLYREESYGSWFYFPWSDAAVRYPPEEIHLELRTGRNKFLIAAGEQERYYYSTATLLGQSVGSHAAAVIAMTGGCRRMRLADPDAVSADNLNRLRAPYRSVGVPKAVLAAREIFEINPYAEVELFPEGITEENAPALLADTDVMIEEMDNPYWKIRSRELARARRVPVLMGTDNGDGVIADIERFDVRPDLPILNGRARGITSENMRSMPKRDLPKVAGSIAGADLVVPRMLDSVAAVGTSLYSWPQLGTAATMCGSVVAYLARRVILGDPLVRSGRYSFNPDAIFETGYRRRIFSRKLAFLRFIRTMSSRV